MSPFQRFLSAILCLKFCLFDYFSQDLKSEIENLEAKLGGSKVITAKVGDEFRAPREDHFFFGNCRPLPLPEALMQFFPGTKKDGPDAHNRQKVMTTLSLWFNVCARAARRYLVAQSRAKWGESVVPMVREVLSKLQVAGYEDITRPGLDESVENDEISPKLAKLLEILKDRPLGRQEQVLVFVEQRDVAYQLSLEIAIRANVSCDWLIGVSSSVDFNNSSHAMMQRFRKFKAGEVAGDRKRVKR